MATPTPAGVPLDGRTIVRGTMINLFQSVLSGALILIVVTPLIYHRLGQSQFGLWTLIWTLAGWFFFLDVGISAGVTRFSGQFAGTADVTKLRKLFCTTCWVYIVFSIIASALAAILAHPLMEAFVGGHNHPAADWVLGILCFFYFLLGGLKSISGILAGLQRIEAAGKLAVWMGFLQLLGVWVWSKWCGEMLALAGVYLVGTVLHILFLVSLLRQSGVGADRFPFSWRLGDIDAGMLKQMVKFSGVVYATTLLVNFLVSDRLYLGWIRTPLDQVGEYHLGALLVGKMVAVLSTFSIAVFPAAAAFEARQDTRRIEAMTLGMFRLYAVTGFFLFVFLGFYVDEIFKVWLGHEIPFAVQITWLLSGWGLTAIWGGLRAVAAAMGRPEIELKTTLLALLGMGLLYPVLIRPFGAKGLAASLTVVFLFSNLMFVCEFRKKVVPLSFSVLAGAGFMKPLLCAVVAVAPPAFLLSGIGADSRLGQAGILFGGFVLSLHIYIAAAWLWGLIRKEDIDLFKSR